MTKIYKTLTPICGAHATLAADGEMNFGVYDIMSERLVSLHASYDEAWNAAADRGRVVVPVELAN